MRGTGETGERGERSLLKKLRKTFMKRGGWISFVQVHLLTNMVPSLALGDRSRAAPDGIRLLRGEIAGYSFWGRWLFALFWGIFFAFAFILHFERITGLWNFVL